LTPREHDKSTIVTQVMGSALADAILRKKFEKVDSGGIVKTEMEIHGLFENSAKYLTHRENSL
jgi:hypothetical protein